MCGEDLPFEIVPGLASILAIFDGRFCNLDFNICSTVDCCPLVDTLKSQLMEPGRKLVTDTEQSGSPLHNKVSSSFSILDFINL